MLKTNKKHVKIDSGDLETVFALSKAVAILGLLPLGVYGVLQLNKEKCDIDYNHAHLYKNDDNVLALSKEEVKTLSQEYYRTEEVVPLADNEALDKYLTKYGFTARQSDNREFIKSLPTEPFMEYEYTYSEEELTGYYGGPSQTITWDGEHGNTLPVRKDVEKTAYTTDPNHENLTGNARYVTPQYIGYKLVLKDNGKAEVVYSDPVNDLSQIEEEYPYFSPTSFQSFTYERIDVNKKTK